MSLPADKSITNGPTDRQTDRRTNGRTHPLIELWLTTKNPFNISIEKVRGRESQQSQFEGAPQGAGLTDTQRDNRWKIYFNSNEIW